MTMKVPALKTILGLCAALVLVQPAQGLPSPSVAEQLRARLAERLQPTALRAQSPGVESQKEDPNEEGAKESSHARQHEPQDVVEFGAAYHLKKGERARSVVIFFAPVKIDGDVEGDVVVVGGQATVAGHVEGGLICVLGSAELRPNARVERQVVTFGGELEVDPSAEIGGERREMAFAKYLPSFHWLTAWMREGLFHLRPIPPGLGWVWTVAAVFALFYLAIALLFGKPVKGCVEALESKPVISFFTGLLVVVAFLPLIVLISVTVVGPLVVVAAYLAAAVFGRVAVLQFLGQQSGRLFRLDAAGGTVIPVLLGSLLLCLLYMVPVLGLMLWLALLPLSLGTATVAAVMSFSSNASSPRAAATSAPAAPPAPRIVEIPTSSAAAPKPVPVAAEPAPLPPAPPTLPSAPGITSAALGLTAAAAGPVLTAMPAMAPPTPAAPPRMGQSAMPAANLDPLAMPRAGFWLRLLATVLDIIPFALIIPFTGAAWILVWTAYHIAMWTWRGCTLGGLVLGLKLVRLDGRPVDLPIAIVRALGSYFSLLIMLVGFFWAGWSREKQSWHDMMAGTVVVKVPRTAPLI